jgi:5-methylcytosine-specific restriction enzyme subunit McrC
MGVVVEQVESASVDTDGYIGRIPVRNLWLLMLYASDLFRTRGIGNVGLEANPDDLPDLIAEILAHAVEVRQRRLNRATVLGMRSSTACADGLMS